MGKFKKKRVEKMWSVSLTPLISHHTLKPWGCLQILGEPEQLSGQPSLPRENIYPPPPLKKGPETFCREASANIAPPTQQGKLPQHLTTIKAVTPTHMHTRIFAVMHTHTRTLSRVHTRAHALKKLNLSSLFLSFVPYFPSVCTSYIKSSNICLITRARTYTLART